MTRRAVRATADLLFQLDRQLPAERGPKGEPTRHEFAASDLLDTFAAFWDDLPVAIPGRPDYRDLLVRRRLVCAAAVRGQRSPRTAPSS